MFAEISETMPNPTPATPDPTRGQVRISHILHPKDFFIIQDFRDKSVLAGLSNLGGLGSLLSTVLAIMFGVSLIQIFYRESFSILGFSADMLTCASCLRRQTHWAVRPNPWYRKLSYQGGVI